MLKSLTRNLFINTFCFRFTIVVVLFFQCFASQVIAGSGAVECPDELLFDFKVKVSSKIEAEKLLAAFFNKKNGFPKFNPMLVKIDDSPSCSGVANNKQTCFYYDNWYGTGESGIGGYLYPNGRLVKKSYCK